MCDAATALAAGSLVVGTVGAFGQAAAAKSAANYQAQMAKNNAIIQENNAQYEEQRAADAKKRGLQERDSLRRKIGAMEGQQRAGFAASGVTLDTGSPLDTISDTAFLGEIDVQNALNSASRESFGYTMNAWNAREAGKMNIAQSNLYRMEAKSISPAMSALGTALSGASSVSDKWNAFKARK